MTSSSRTNANSKRKSGWLDMDDAFNTAKRPKVVKNDASQYKTFDFAPPTFDEPGKTSQLQKESQSLPQPPLFVLSTNKNPRVASTHTKDSLLFEPPRPPPPFVSPSTPPRGKRKVTLESIPVAPPLEVYGETSSVIHRTMRSALDTPFAVGPPSSQESSGSQSTATQYGAKLEFERGIGPSPEKKGHSLARTSHKGGLAGHARALMARSTTDFCLWYEDTLANGRASTGAALQARVISVISRMPSSDPPLIPSPFAAGRSSFNNVLTLTHVQDGEGGSRQLLVLFASLDKSRVGGAAVGISDAQEIGPEKSVRIWRPWSEITWENKAVIMCSRFVVR